MRQKPAMSRVDYDRVAPTYDARYRLGGPLGIADCLLAVADGAARVLEVGCGTGHWLAELSPRVGFACGLDRSRGMLDKARAAGVPLIHGDACALPFRGASLDAIVCVNALHHFPAPRDFIGDAARSLRPGGGIAVINMDPSAGLDRWYLYDYFPGTLATDEHRFPSGVQIAAWMEESGFTRIERGVASRIHATMRGRDVFSDPILSKTGTSQLTLISDEAFAAGMARIERDADAGKEFVTDLSLSSVVAIRT